MDLATLWLMAMKDDSKRLSCSIGCFKDRSSSGVAECAACTASVLYRFSRIKGDSPSVTAVAAEGRAEITGRDEGRRSARANARLREYL